MSMGVAVHALKLNQGHCLRLTKSISADGESEFRLPTAYD
jgi:hypothetical protein